MVVVLSKAFEWNNKTIDFTCIMHDFFLPLLLDEKMT